MKQRFSSLAVGAVAANLQKNIVGMRLANVYDLSGKTYLLKFSQPDKKIFLLLESSVRFHTTSFTRDKADLPSVFNMKLRKHLRAKRLESLKQIGVDRAIDLRMTLVRCVSAFLRS